MFPLKCVTKMASITSIRDIRTDNMSSNRYLIPSMAEKLPPKFEGYIELNERIYNPGDTVSGKAHLELRKKLCCDTITAKLYGSARVFFTKTLPSNKPGTLTRNEAYEQEIVLVDVEKKLWSAPNNGYKRQEVTIDDIARMARSTSIRPTLPKADLGSAPGLDAGGHDYDFTFDLPKQGLHTSFDAKNAAGYVRYYILLEAKNNNLVVFKKKLLFPVVIPVHLENNFKAVEMPEVTDTVTVAKGTVTAILQLDKRGFVPGEPVTGNITIHNRSKESVKTAFLRIHQTTEAYSKRPTVELKESSFETAGMGLPIHKVVAGQSYTYPISYYIPALIPNFDIDSCLRVQYSLKLTVGMNRACMCKGIIDLSVPILIGSHPARGVDFSEDGPSMPEKEREGDQFGFYPPPPSYAQCVNGVSDVRDDDDEPVSGDYAPLLYQYNYELRNRAPRYEQ